MENWKMKIKMEELFIYVVMEGQLLEESVTMLCCLKEPCIYSVHFFRDYVCKTYIQNVILVKHSSSWQKKNVIHIPFIVGFTW